MATYRLQWQTGDFTSNLQASIQAYKVQFYDVSLGRVLKGELRDLKVGGEVLRLAH